MWAISKILIGLVTTLLLIYVLVYFVCEVLGILSRRPRIESIPSAMESESESRSVVSNSLQPHGLCSPGNSPGQNTGVGSLSLIQGIFPTQGSNSGLQCCRWILYQLSHKGSPCIGRQSPNHRTTREVPICTLVSQRTQNPPPCIHGSFHIPYITMWHFKSSLFLFPLPAVCWYVTCALFPHWPAWLALNI